MGTWQKISNYFAWLEDKYYISPKLIYFIISSVYYALYLFRPKFIEGYLEMSGREYGDIIAVMSVISFAFMTVWSSVADALGRHRLVLGFLCIMITVSVEVAMFVKLIEDHMTRFYLTLAMMCGYALFGSGIPPLMDFLILKMLSNRPGFNRDLYGRQRLWGTISYGFITLVMGQVNKAMGIQSLFYVMPVCSALSVLVLMMLAPRDDPKSIKQLLQKRKPGDMEEVPAEPFKSPMNSPSTLKPPSQVEYGHVEGHRTSSLHLPSPLNSAQSGEGERGVNGSIKSAPVSLRNEPIAPASPYDTSIEQEKQAAAAEAAKSKTKRPIVRLLTNSNYLFMLFVVFMSGSARAVMTTFLSKYWLNDMGLSDTSAAIGANFGILMEIVIFFFGPWLITTFGIYWMLIFAQTALATRAWAYFILPAESGLVWAVYLIELLKGVAFGFTQSAGVKLAADCAPAGLEATAQALYTSVYSQLPVVFTAFAGGRVYQIYGAHMLFFVTAIVSTAALGLFIVKYAFDGSIRLPCSRPRRRHSTPPIIVTNN